VSRSNDVTGRRFGVLTAVTELRERQNGHAMWLYRCDCGNEGVMRADNLTLRPHPVCVCDPEKTRRRLRG
jgi:hypothetical protein